MKAILAALSLLALAACASVPRGTATIAPFHSDGCSLFPDGRPERPGLWCDCCLAHDLAYWRGGTADERLAADQALRACVLERTGNPVMAETIYLGVRLGGAPALPTWYRWGYGWSSRRGNWPLGAGEREAADAQEAAYRLRNPDLRCDARGEPLSRCGAGAPLR